MPIVEITNPIAGGAGYVVQQQAVGSPALGSNTAVHAAVTLANGATTTTTTGFTNPDVPRVLVAKGNASGITGNVVITGTDINDAALTETIVAADAGAVVGLKAFKTVTQVVFPARTAPGDTISIGVGAALGLAGRLSRNTVLAAYLDGVKEATAPTVTTDNTHISLNTATLDSALDGSAVVIDFYDS